MQLKFASAFDPTHLGSPGPRGVVTLDTDRKLLTGGEYMGGEIPTWGGDGQIFFDLTTAASGTALFQYNFDPTISGHVLFATEQNDGRWFARGDSLSIIGSLSIFDAFEKSPTGSKRIATGGLAIATVSSLDIGPFDPLGPLHIIDSLPASPNAVDLASGQILPALTWDPTKVQSQSDPSGDGPIGRDLTRIDAEVVDNKLVIKAVVLGWRDTDPSGLFDIALDTDMNNTTYVGFRWTSNNGGQEIGPDYHVVIGTSGGATGAPAYLVDLIHPDGTKTIHDAILSAHPSASLTEPGSFTVTIPLEALGRLGPKLRFYVISGSTFGALGDDTAPPSPW